MMTIARKTKVEAKASAGQRMTSKGAISNAATARRPTSAILLSTHTLSKSTQRALMAKYVHHLLVAAGVADLEKT